MLLVVRFRHHGLPENIFFPGGGGGRNTVSFKSEDQLFYFFVCSWGLLSGVPPKWPLKGGFDDLLMGAYSDMSFCVQISVYDLITYNEWLPGHINLLLPPSCGRPWSLRHQMLCRYGSVSFEHLAGRNSTSLMTEIILCIKNSSKIQPLLCIFSISFLTHSLF